MDTIETSGNEDAKVYEIGYFLVPTIPEEKVGNHTEGLKALLAKHSAEIIADEAPARRPLAYRIQKKIGPTHHRFDEGYFGWIKFALDKGSINDVKVALDTDESVIRYLLITTVRENTYLGKAAPLVKEEVVADKVVVEGENVEVVPGVAVTETVEVVK